MEPQQSEVESVYAPLNKVTPLSKYLAMALFIILPFMGGWIGYSYAPEKVVEVEKEVIKELAIRNETEEKVTQQPGVTERCMDDLRFCEKVIYLDQNGEVFLGDHEINNSHTIMLGVSDNTELFDSYVDSDTVIFITRTNIFYRYPERTGPVGYGPSFLAVHTYDLASNRLNTLFTSNDTDNTYIRINSPNTSERVWKFSVLGCDNCGPSHPQTFLYDSKNRRNSKTIGATLNFEMISDTDYRYKVYNPDPDNDKNVICEHICTYLSTDHLPWVYGNIEN